MKRAWTHRRQLVFSDNEGCIVEAKGKEFDLAELSRLKLFLASTKNLGFSICTGRSVPYVEAITQVLGINNSPVPCICEGGCVLYWPSQDRVEFLVRPFPIGKVAERLPRDLFRVEPGKTCCLSLYPMRDLEVSQVANVVTPFLDPSLYTLRLSAAAVDITPHGVDKGFGIRMALKAMRYSNGRIVAVGDSDNDLPMFDAVEYTAAPSNATQLVKSRANFVSRFPATTGLIDILEHL
jgi:hydroxymethylpyrimidine pyrophosphatase-like HAD family hydrolase